MRLPEPGPFRLAERAGEQRPAGRRLHMRATGGREARVHGLALGIVFGCAAAASALAAGALIPDLAQAQPTSYNVRVVDQNGLTLAGSLVRVEGGTADVTTPGTITLEPGPHL